MTTVAVNGVAHAHSDVASDQATAPSASTVSTSVSEHARPAAEATVTGAADRAPTQANHLAIPVAPEATLQQQATSDSAGLEKKKDIPERRILPARLRRVSALLGDGLEEQLIGSTENQGPQRILPDSTILVLSDREGHKKDAFEAAADESGMDSLDLFADPQIALACKETALIETPDYRLRDDFSQMGKTRGGGATRTEEDTSDAAYERLHRRPDNAEKKQRRLEKDRLVRERQKLRDRVEHLKTADPRMLMPIVAARERNQSPSSNNQTRGGEAAMGLGKQNMSAEASANLQKIEKLRKELIAETMDMLARYDTVLSEAPPLAGEKHLQESPAHASPTSSFHRRDDAPNRTAHLSSTPTTKAPRPRASAGVGAADTNSQSHKAKPAEPATPVAVPRSAASPAASSPIPAASPGSPANGDVRPENVHRNIHARTGGGRFAPRASLVDENGNPLKPARAPRPSEIARKAVKEAQRAAKAAGLSPEEIKAAGEAAAAEMASPAARRSAQAQAKAQAAAAAAAAAKAAGGGAASPSSTTATPGASGSAKSATSAARSLATKNNSSRRRDSSTSGDRSISPSSLYSSSPWDQKRQANKTGPSLSEIDAAERKPKRLKLTLGNKPGAEGEGAEASESAQQGEEAEAKPQFAAPGALSLEQAQKMMAAAMAASRSGASAPPPQAAQTAQAAQVLAANPDTAAAAAAAAALVASDAAAQASTSVDDMQGVETAGGSATSFGSLKKNHEQGQYNPASDDSNQDAAMIVSSGEPSLDESSRDTHPSDALFTPATTIASKIPAVATTETSEPSASTTVADSSSAAQASRASDRVKELSRSAFGEKISSRALMKEDFEKAMQGVVVEQGSSFGQGIDSALRGGEHIRGGDETVAESGSVAHDGAGGLLALFGDNEGVQSGTAT